MSVKHVTSVPRPGYVSARFRAACPVRSRCCARPLLFGRKLRLNEATVSVAHTGKISVACADRGTGEVYVLVQGPEAVA